MMGLAQVVKNPDSLTVHAEVPNEACASCHVYGDADQWNLIARSRGHRVHLESEDPELEGLMCVECHSTSVHQFTSTDLTCRECHDESDIIMTGMHDISMNCAACHAFNAPLEAIPADDPLQPSPEGALQGALTPGAGECLSCHTMRTMVETPEDDPHESTCGACHNPHSQEVAADAAVSCATAGCHDGPADELSTFHVGIDEEVLDVCLECHTAHDFHAEGQDCLACHTDIFEDARPTSVPTEIGAALPAGSHPGVGLVRTAAVSLAASSFQHAVEASLALSAAPDSIFRHAEHQDVDCLSCHTMDTSHGEVTIQALGDCRQCHHSPPQSSDCATCHADSGLDDRTFSRTVTFALSTGDDVTRSLPFDHTEHESTDCSTCHTEGTSMSVAAVDCNSCHEEHHEVGVTCSTCHTPSPQAEHTVDTHVGCAGAGCHEDAPFQGVPRERELCLVCHVEQIDHQVQARETCADCHALPEPGSVTGVQP